MVNLNVLARAIAKMEGKKQSISIAQIKEVIKCISICMYYNPVIVAKLIRNGEKHATKKKRRA